MAPTRIIAIVVTYNRKDLLLQCLGALQAQSRAPQIILVVDNCSTDGTDKAITELAKDDTSISYLRLSTNIGGSGGFQKGMEFALNFGDSWLWLMDDDAYPVVSCLEKLAMNLSSPNNILGSVAVGENQHDNSLCWPVLFTSSDGSVHRSDNLSTLPSLAFVCSLPFLGFMIHTSLVKKIGLPREDYFISGDDTEYCLRANLTGAKITLVSSSIIRHPVPQRCSVSLLGTTITILSLQPWKRYYDTRNRILIAKEYYGIKLWTETLPGTLMRWLVILFSQKDKLSQSRAFFFGMIDGMLGRTGIRWLPGK